MYKQTDSISNSVIHWMLDVVSCRNLFAPPSTAERLWKLAGDNVPGKAKNKLRRGATADKPTDSDGKIQPFPNSVLPRANSWFLFLA